jgi:hypothetical protein
MIVNLGARSNSLINNELYLVLGVFCLELQMDCHAISELERILFDESAEPQALPLSLLEHITNNFSDDKRIGHGGFAVVYKV